MASPYALLLAAARVTIAGLTPTVSPGVPFVSVSGSLALEAEPDPGSRRFEVRGGGFPEASSQIGTSHYRRSQPFRVAIRYDSYSDLDTLEALVSEDDLLVIGTLERPTFWAGVSGVRAVTCTGGDIASAGDEGGHFAIRTLSFVCDFHHSIP